MPEQSSNSFAVVVLAYLKTNATVKNSGKRVREKIILLRLLSVPERLFKSGYHKSEGSRNYDR